MKYYDLIKESMTPCGGTKYATRTIEEIICESPEIYAKENSPFPIMEITQLPNGDTVIVTGDGKGYLVRYTFSE